VGLFDFFKRETHFFSSEEEKRIMHAIEEAEKNSSGEIRLFVESHCEYMDPIRRAKELFAELHMHETSLHNGVLIYIAMKDRQLAIFGDAGIHERVGSDYWAEEVRKMIDAFKKQSYVDGICGIISDIGSALSTNFPFDPSSDRNELSNQIVFGK
jgi:uncharacterized membrane protein